MVFLACGAASGVRTYELLSDSIQLHRTMSPPNAEVTCARYNHNGKILASCSVDGGICLDVAATGELLSRFFYPAKSLPDRRVNSVHFSSGSRFLASGGGDGCVRVWDLKTQEVTQTYSVSASRITSVAFSGYKDDYIVAGSVSGAIALCDVKSADTVGFLAVDPKFPVASVTSVLSSPHPYARQVLGSTYSDGSVRVWDLQTGQLTAEFANQHDEAATSLAISPVSKVLLATGGLDRRVLFFDTLQHKELRSMDFDHPVTALALCADGKTLAVGTIQGELLVYDLRGAITPLYATSTDGAIHSLQFATPSVDGTSTIVAPQGQPIISTDRTQGQTPLSPPAAAKSESTNREMALQKLQALALETEPLSDDPSPLSIPRQPHNFTISIPSSATHAETADRLADAQPPTEVPPPSTSPIKLGERRSSEPSLLSMLTPINTTATEQAPLPLTSPTATIQPADTPPKPVVSSAFTEQIEQLYLDMEQSRRSEQERVTVLLQTLTSRLETLTSENHSLRLENEALKAYIEEKRGQYGAPRDKVSV